MSLIKDLFGWLSITIKVSSKSRSHAKIVDKERMLVNVLKNAKLAFI